MSDILINWKRENLIKNKVDGKALGILETLGPDFFDLEMLDWTYTYSPKHTKKWTYFLIWTCYLSNLRKILDMHDCRMIVYISDGMVD